MLPPIRCFTCGRVVADQYDYYLKEVQKLETKEAEAKDHHSGPTARAKKQPSRSTAEAQELLHFDGVLSGPIMDKLGLKRYCCRRMMLGIKDMMDTI